MFHQPQAWLRINILLQAINLHFCSTSNWLLGNLVHKGSCSLHILLWSKFSAFTIIHLIWRKMSEDPPPPYWESSKSDLGAGQQPPADLGGPPGDENPFLQPDWPNVKIRSLQMMAVKRQRLKPHCFFLFCQLSWWNILQSHGKCRLPATWRSEWLPGVSYFWDYKSVDSLQPPAFWIFTPDFISIIWLLINSIVT